MGVRVGKRLILLGLVTWPRPRVAGPGLDPRLWTIGQCLLPTLLASWLLPGLERLCDNLWREKGDIFPLRQLTEEKEMKI